MFNHKQLYLATILVAILCLGFNLQESGAFETFSPAPPKPKLIVTGTEDYEVRGNEFTRYNLEVTNYSFYSDELFEPAPDLPPCGLNTNASRTWVEIYSDQGSRLYGFCALTSAEDLTRLWFARPRDTVPPKHVYIVLNDRRSRLMLTSNLASTAVQHDCYADLPDPQLAFGGTEDYEVGDNQFTRYRLEVANYADYPDELFAPAPDLPPCGLNENAARTWVDIYDDQGAYLYGFCALSSAAGLRSLWFATPRGVSPPPFVHIVLRDRRCNTTWTSNRVATSTQYNCYSQLPDPILVLKDIKQDAIGENEFTRYLLEVTNYAEYPDALFASAPDLPPCGLNEGASRTEVRVYDEEGNYRSGFCSFAAADHLNHIWFVVPKDALAPQFVHITMTDRRCNTTYTSEPVAIAGVAMISEIIFNGLEEVLHEFLYPANSPTFTIGDFMFRTYPGSNSFIGIFAGRRATEPNTVFYIGPLVPGKIFPIGTTEETASILEEIRHR